MRPKLAKVDMMWEDKKNVQERHSDFMRDICNCCGKWYFVDWRVFATIYAIYYLPEVEKEKSLIPYKFDAFYIQGVQNLFFLMGIRLILGQYCVMYYL